MPILDNHQKKTNAKSLKFIYHLRRKSWPTLSGDELIKFLTEMAQGKQKEVPWD
jgi:hypothetical protein